MPDTPPSTPQPQDPRTLPLHLEISRQAYRLWEQYGRPEGRDVSIWLEAERQLLGTDPLVRQQSGGAVPAGPLADALYPVDRRESDPGGEPVGIPPPEAPATGQPPR